MNNINLLRHLPSNHAGNNSQENVNQQRRYSCQERACHLYIPGNDLTASHIVESDRYRPIGWAGQHDRKQEVIPG